MHLGSAHDLVSEISAELLRFVNRPRRPSNKFDNSVSIAARPSSPGAPRLEIHEQIDIAARRRPAQAGMPEE